MLCFMFCNFHDNSHCYLVYLVFMFCNAQRYLVYVVDLVFDGRSKEG